MRRTLKHLVLLSVPVLLLLVWYWVNYTERSGEVDSLDALRDSTGVGVGEGLAGFPHQGPIRWEEDRQNHGWALRLVGRTSLDEVRRWAGENGELHTVDDPPDLFEIGSPGDRYYLFHKVGARRIYRIKVYEDGRFQISVFLRRPAGKRAAVHGKFASIKAPCCPKRVRYHDAVCSARPGRARVPQMSERVRRVVGPVLVR